MNFKLHMDIYNFEYGTTPRKEEPRYKKRTKVKKQYQKQLKINQEQRKNAIKLEKKKHNKNIAYIVAIFFILLTVSYRSSLINERFNAIQNDKQKLASIEKTNGQLEVSIESSVNLSNIEQAAKDKLGMKKVDNSQKVFVTLDKKDYVECSEEYAESIVNAEETWFDKVINSIFKK